MVNVTLSFQGSNGDVIEFSDNGPFILTTGVLGFGIPPVQVRIDPSAADGGVHRFTRRGVRDLDLPIVIIDTDRDTVEQELRRLANLLNDTAGPTIIRATYSTGEVWELSGHYVGGADAVRGEEENLIFARWVVQLQCPNPYWIRQASESVSVGTGGAGRGLIGTGRTLSKLQVSSSQAIGTVILENPGDVDAYPVWQFEGPMDSVTITNSDGTKTFTYDAPILLGSTVTVDTFTGLVTDQTGANQYANLGPSPKFFTIPAGESDAEILAIGTDANSLISLFFQPRKEVVH